MKKSLYFLVTAFLLTPLLFLSAASQPITTERPIDLVTLVDSFIIAKVIAPEKADIARLIAKLASIQPAPATVTVQNQTTGSVLPRPISPNNMASSQSTPNNISYSNADLNNIYAQTNSSSVPGQTNTYVNNNVNYSNSAYSSAPSVSNYDTTNPAEMASFGNDLFSYYLRSQSSNLSNYTTTGQSASNSSGYYTTTNNADQNLTQASNSFTEAGRTFSTANSSVTVSTSLASTTGTGTSSAPLFTVSNSLLAHATTTPQGYLIAEDDEALFADTSGGSASGATGGGSSGGGSGGGGSTMGGIDFGGKVTLSMPCLDNSALTYTEIGGDSGTQKIMFMIAPPPQGMWVIGKASPAKQTCATCRGKKSWGCFVTGNTAIYWAYSKK